MYDLHLTAEQLEIRDTVRDFVAQEIKPVALKADRLESLDRSVPKDLLDKASRLGLRTLALSEALGGAGADALTCCIVTEELAAGDADIAAVLAETSRLGHILFDRQMTEEQRDRFLPQFLDDDRYHLAVADREPDSETALGLNYHRPASIDPGIKTTAVRASSGDWIINGVKDCVANAPIAALFAVQVRTSGHAGVSTLLVPRETQGVAVREHDAAQAWHHGPCGTLTLTDCQIPARNLLGAEGQSPLIEDAPGRAIPQSQALNLGIGRAAYEAALDYAQLRVQGGRRIVEHQAIGTKLAEIAIRLDVARTAVWRAAWASDHPDAYADRSLPDLPLQTIAEVFTAEAIYRATKDAAECFGAMGVMRDMPLQKYVHDALVCLHAGNGTSDAKLRIAETLVNYRHFPAASARAAE
jgi:alkylation response protein AidB-like acyl-CoA dehydrogenase